MLIVHILTLPLFLLGAGTGKSHILKATKAFMECPAVRGDIPDGGLLTVAFQGKQAASVGETTIHCACSTAGNDNGNLSANHEDQQPLPDSKAIHWKGVSVLAIEEVSMVGCTLLPYYCSEDNLTFTDNTPGSARLHQTSFF